MNRRWGIGGVLFVAACGGSGNSTTAESWPDASSCSALPDVNNPATGSISGNALSATMCPNGHRAYIDSTPLGMTPFYFVIVEATASALPDVAFQRPPDAFGGNVYAAIALNAPEAGTYTGPSGSALEWLTFTYYLPAPRSVHCEPAGPIACSPGCGRICPVSGCGSIPCIPQAPSVNYTATGWTLTLTSVVDEQDSGLPTPHGTLTATMVEDDAGANTADLSTTF